MNNISKPTYFEKGFAEDHRGSLEFYNDIKLDEFKRFYIVNNPKKGTVRAWHGHKIEAKLVKVLREKNFPLENKQWVLVSIDPERDTPEQIDKYAKGFDEAFIGVSNTRPMLLNLATQLSVNNIMPNEDKMDHSHLDNHVNNIILLNPNGEFAGVFRPPFDLPRLSLTYQSVTQ